MILALYCSCTWGTASTLGPPGRRKPSAGSSESSPGPPSWSGQKHILQRDPARGDSVQPREEKEKGEPLCRLLLPDKHREDGAGFFLEVHGSRMGATDTSWKTEISKQTRGNLCNGLPRGVLEPASLEVFETQLDITLSNLI